jgi:hypothetical protein
VLAGHDGTVFSVDVSPDASRIVSGGQDQSVKLWDVRSGQELRAIRFGEPVRSVAFSPDGRQIAASGTNGTVRIFEAAHSGRQGFESSRDTAVQSINREALGLVIHFMERGLTKSKARQLLAAHNSSFFGRGEREGTSDAKVSQNPFVVSEQSRWLESARRATLAQMAFRRGDMLAGERLLHDTPAINVTGVRWYYLKALVQAELGEPEGRESFVEAERQFAWAPSHWTTRVFHEFIRDEAREVIKRELGGPK